MSSIRVFYAKADADKSSEVKLIPIDSDYSKAHLLLAPLNVQQTQFPTNKLLLI